MSGPSKDRVLWHQSGVNKNGEPFIQLLIDDEVVCQLSPEQARDHAKNVLESTEASEQDAFLLQFFTQKIAAPPEHAMQIVLAFRQWREERGKKGPPSDVNDFMRTATHEKLPGEPE